MKRKAIVLILFWVCVLLAFCPPVMAEDLVLEGNLPGGNYDSDGRIVMQNNCTVASGVTVTTSSAFEAILKPGTHIQQGSAFTASLKDADGISNYWEMESFGTLTYGPDDDPDGDGVNNSDEYALGTHPCYDSNIPDSDNDGLPDLWELKYWAGDLSHSGVEDTDGDGVINSVEYELGSNPTVDDSAGLLCQCD